MHFDSYICKYFKCKYIYTSLKSASELLLLRLIALPLNSGGRNKQMLPLVWVCVLTILTCPLCSGHQIKHFFTVGGGWGWGWCGMVGCWGGLDRGRPRSVPSFNLYLTVMVPIFFNTIGSILLRKYPRQFHQHQVGWRNRIQVYGWWLWVATVETVCICSNCKKYLFKLLNTFVQIASCICLNCKIWLWVSPFETARMQIRINNRWLSPSRRLFKCADSIDLWQLATWS